MKKVFCLFLLLLFTISLFAGPSVERYISSSARQTKDTSATQVETLSEMLYALGNLYNYLNVNFLYDIDTKEMEYEVIEAMVNSLGDKYSYFVRPDDTDAYLEESNGKYLGIGTYLTKANPSQIDWNNPESYMIVIVSPFPGGPADRAGLRANDLISQINGEDVYELDATAASKKMRGQKDTPITLTVHRGAAVFDITLTPEEVTTPTCDAGIISDDIGYIAISTFSLSTYESFINSVNDVLEKGAKSLIIDLRNNGGGTVDSSLNIANVLLPENKVLITTEFKEGSSGTNTTYTSNSTMVVPEDFPIYLLVNEGTASASEILTSALQENGRAVVVGAKTFGKGIMQLGVPFMNGMLNLTVASYNGPNGESFHEIGITPDYVVDTQKEYTSEELKAFVALQNSETLSSWLKEYPDYTKENILAFAEENKDSGVPEELLCLLMRNEYIYSLDYDDRPIADPDFDTQLSYAISLIKGTNE